MWKVAVVLFAKLLLIPAVHAASPTPPVETVVNVDAFPVCTPWEGAATKVILVWPIKEEPKLMITLMGAQDRLKPGIKFVSTTKLDNGISFLSWCPGRFERCVEVPTGEVTVNSFDGELLRAKVSWVDGGKAPRQVTFAARVRPNRSGCLEEKRPFWNVYENSPPSAVGPTTGKGK